MAEFKVKHRVWIGLGFAIVAIGAWWMWSQAKLPVPPGKPPVVTPAIRLTKVGTALNDQVLRDRAEYFDPTPLFFPTEWNYGQGEMWESRRRQPGQVFGDVEPKFVSFQSYSNELPMVHLEDVVTSGNEVPFGGMGEIDVKPEPLADRSGFLEVKGMRDGETILAHSITGVAIPRLDFAPLEFLVVIGNAGMVAEPVLTVGSGWDDVDLFFRTYLAKSFRVGEGIRPGIYRVLIGP